MLSVRDIETKTFSRSKTGYKEEEVEAFLDEIIVDYTALLEEKESLGKKVIVLSEKLETIRDEQEARMQSKPLKRRFTFFATNSLPTLKIFPNLQKRNLRQLQ